MRRGTLSFIALAISMLYGAGFAVLDDRPDGYAVMGAVIVALSWVAVGRFGKDDPEPASASAAEPTTPVPPVAPALPQHDPTLTQGQAPWGTPPVTQEDRTPEER